MELTFVIALISIGFILFLVELLIVPGTTVIGFLGFGAMVYGIYRTFAHFGNVAGFIALGVLLLICAILIIWVVKRRSWKRLMLNDELDNKVNTIDETKIKVGDSGTAISRLAPIGQAMINDDIYEVHSMSGFVDEKTEVEVIRLEGNKIYVKTK